MKLPFPFNSLVAGTFLLLLNSCMTTETDLYTPLETPYSKLRQSSPNKTQLHANELLQMGKGNGSTREIFEDEDFSHQDFSSHYWYKSGVENSTFFNADLTRSALNWSDFIDVDFSYADLRYADLRSSLFEDVKFDYADLRGAEMRRSGFSGCSFEGAQMEGVILSEDYKSNLNLTDEQIAQIHWTSDPGVDADGG